MLRSKVFFAPVFALLLGASAWAAPPAAITDGYLDITGEPVVVYDWSRDRCSEIDTPDMPARAFRDAAGVVQFIDTSKEGRRSTGPTLLEQTHRCKIVSKSALSPDPAMHADEEWLASVYTEDGKTIYALLHNEYQGSTHKGRCPSKVVGKCVYNTVGLAVSVDGGKSYRHAVKPPGHLVAALPGQYVLDNGPYGLFEPSNMIKGKDGYIYSFLRATTAHPARQWACLMRTDNLADPKAWRAWDGRGFDLPFIDPYDPDAPSGRECAPVSFPEIGMMHYSVSYNTYLDQYVLVDVTGDPAGNQVGFYYAFSKDLVHWSPRQLLRTAEAVWTYAKGDEDPLAYPSLLDPESPSRNFETTGEHAFLYYTRFNKNRPPDMDLLRVPVTFSKAEVAAPQFEFTLKGTAPAGADQALMGFRFNDECQCSGSVDLTLYALKYAEGAEGENIVPNSTFTLGKTDWAIWGNTPVALTASDLSPHGQALTVLAKPGQTADMNGAAFPVTGGSMFTATAVAQVRPLTTRSGYFFVIFMSHGREIGRQQIWPKPNAD